MGVDKDVATVLALEEPARALFTALDAAWPAIKRLEEAKYPGAEYVAEQVGTTLEGDLTAGRYIETGSLYEVVEALEVFRKAQGDLGAEDYHYLVGRIGHSVAEAAAELLEYAHDDAHVERVVGLQKYAASVAR
jgi:hypothetical protein